MNDERGDRAPFVAAAEAGHGLLAIGAFARSRRGHMRDRSAVTDARHGLAAFDRSGEVHRISLGFDGLHGTTHGKFNQLA